MDSESRYRTNSAPQKAFALMRCGKTGDGVVGVFYRVGGNWQLTYSSLTGDDPRVGPGEALSLKGQFSCAAEYPGCASCFVGSYVKCASCARLSCWDANTELFRCGWCGSTGPVEGLINQVSAGRD